MLTFTLRRLMFAIPTLILISLAIFFLLEIAPGDPMASVPLTVPSEVKEQMRQALGLGEPAPVRYMLWLRQFFWVEPLNVFDHMFGTTFAEGELRIISWQNRSPVFLTIAERIPQTLWVVGTSYIVAIIISIPIGIYSAYRQYSLFDQAGTFITMVGFSVPPFFSGVVVILVFSVSLGWFPTIYDTRLVVNDWESFMKQVNQMILPVMVLALQITSQLSRFMRASVLDNLQQDYVRTARAKGMSENRVILIHVVRNSLLPVVTVIALYVPAIFSGAIITEQIFKVNGIGQLLITALQANDWPMVQTLSFIFAILIVVCNLIADLLYGLLDPRIRYD